MSFIDLAALTIHDVKNRLAMLAGRAEAAGDDIGLREAIEAADALARLLTLFKAESGKLHVDMDARTPDDLLQELQAWAGRLSAIPVRIGQGQRPTLWFYDEALVRLILSSAVHNAQRHANSRVHLDCTVSDDGQWLSFTVRDDGPGYPDELLANLAAPSPVSRQGTGLGLQLAERVAGLHHNNGLQGRIQLANDGGAVFTLFLPQ